jgi:hypothetical protein
MSGTGFVWIRTEFFQKGPGHSKFKSPIQQTHPKEGGKFKFEFFFQLKQPSWHPKLKMAKIYYFKLMMWQEGV